MIERSISDILDSEFVLLIYFKITTVHIHSALIVFQIYGINRKIRVKGIGINAFGLICLDSFIKNQLNTVLVEY